MIRETVKQVIRFEKEKFLSIIGSANTATPSDQKRNNFEIVFDKDERGLLMKKIKERPSRLLNREGLKYYGPKIKSVLHFVCYKKKYKNNH